MGRISLKLWMPGLLVWLGLFAAEPAVCTAQQGRPTFWSPPAASVPGKPSFTESISSAVKGGVDKFTGMVAPETPVRPAEDPVSLRSQAKPGPELYVRVARLYEESGRLPEAAELYKRALKQAPNYLGALLGYARLRDRLGDPEGAGELYHQAARTYPNEATVHNNLALFYARRQMLDASVGALERAIQLQPRNPKYRNNIATVLVETGRPREAFMHLQTVHSEAVAYYNLGYLLEKKGQVRAAAEHFAIALQKNPSLVQARHGLDRLASSSVQDRPPAERSNDSIRVGSRPMPPGQRAPAGTTAPQPPAGGSPPNPDASRVTSPGGQHPAVRRLPPPPVSPDHGEVRKQEWHPRWSLRTSRESSTPERLPPTAGQPSADRATVAPLPQADYTRPPVPTAPLPR